jgi:hypothetical protein
MYNWQKEPSFETAKAIPPTPHLLLVVPDPDNHTFGRHSIRVAAIFVPKSISLAERSSETPTIENTKSGLGREDLLGDPTGLLSFAWQGQLPPPGPGGTVLAHPPGTVG